MGFHSLLIEGALAENSRRVPDQIVSALVELHADNVQRIGNRISFSAGIFSFRRWVGPHPLAFVSSGEIEIEPSGDVLMVNYRLRFSQWLIICTVMVLFVATRMGLRSSDSPLGWSPYYSQARLKEMFGATAVLYFTYFLGLVFFALGCGMTYQEVHLYQLYSHPPPPWTRPSN
jgi:hypothetical protein